MEDPKWLISSLYKPPKDEILETKDMQGNQRALKWNGLYFTSEGRIILPQPIYWLKKP